MGSAGYKTAKADLKADGCGVNVAQSITEQVDPDTKSSIYSHNIAAGVSVNATAETLKRGNVLLIE